VQIHKSNEVRAISCLSFKGDVGWEPAPDLHIRDGSIVVTQFDDYEHDRILDICDGLEESLKGLRANLLISNRKNDDRKFINLTIPPTRGDIIRDQDRYYRIDFVLQSTSYSLSVFCTRVEYGSVGFDGWS